MNRENTKTVVLIGIVVAIIVTLIAFVMIYSGMNPALTVIDSKSMEHSDEKSQLGVIDTGDMVVMVSPGKTSITTYVEGYHSGYSKFGDYGDVIIYYREDGSKGNPIIHRAILWLDYNETTKKWSAPALANYPSEYWDNEGNTDCMNMIGKLRISLMKDYSTGERDFYEIDLTSMKNNNSNSGYLTKGDNNNSFDQPGLSNKFIGKDRIKAVAGLEIPWLGCIKLKINDTNVNMIKGNSIPCLIVEIIDIIAFLIVLMLIIEYAVDYIFDKKEANKPAPIIRKSKRRYD